MTGPNNGQDGGVSFGFAVAMAVCSPLWYWVLHNWFCVTVVR